MWTWARDGARQPEMAQTGELVWLSGGVGGMSRTPDELLGMGKVAGRRAGCSLWGVHRLYFTPH